MLAIYSNEHLWNVSFSRINAWSSHTDCARPGKLIELHMLIVAIKIFHKPVEKEKVYIGQLRINILVPMALREDINVIPMREDRRK